MTFNHSELKTKKDIINVQLHVPFLLHGYLLITIIKECVETNVKLGISTIFGQMELKTVFILVIAQLYILIDSIFQD